MPALLWDMSHLSTSVTITILGTIYLLVQTSPTEQSNVKILAATKRERAQQDIRVGAVAFNYQYLGEMSSKNRFKVLLMLGKQKEQKLSQKTVD